MDAHKLGGVPLVGDARETLASLQEMVLQEGIARDVTAYSQEVQRLKAEWDGIVDDLRQVSPTRNVSQAQVMGVVNDAAGPRDVVINAAGSMPGDLLKLWRSENPKSYHIEYGYSCMGYEIPAGIGVKMAAPERDVFVFIGDGSYLMLNTEIVTAVQEGIKIVIILVDNGGFQSIHGLQMSSGTPSFGNELRYRDESARALAGPHVEVDFVANAESLGARGIRVDDLAELRAALDEAKAETRPTLISIRVDENARVPNFEGWWDVPIAQASEEASVKEARARYEEDVQKQRVVW